MKGVSRSIGTTLAIMAILFVALKGCVMTTWESPVTPTTYAVHGSDGRSLALIFLPKNETILLYTEEKTKFMEAALTKMLGTYGTHYFWRLWKIEGPDTGGGLFGYRIYPAGSEPVVMETTVVKKFIHGSSTPTLRSEGDRTHPIILFSENAVSFDGNWLTVEPTHPELIQALLAKLKPQREAINDQSLQ